MAAYNRAMAVVREMDAHVATCEILSECDSRWQSTLERAMFRRCRACQRAADAERSFDEIRDATGITDAD
jgi:hypothetical protein